MAQSSLVKLNALLTHYMHSTMCSHIGLSQNQTIRIRTSLQPLNHSLINKLRITVSLTLSTASNASMLSAEYRPAVLFTVALLTHSLSCCAFSNAYNKPHVSCYPSWPHHSQQNVYSPTPHLSLWQVQSSPRSQSLELLSTDLASKQLTSR